MARGKRRRLLIVATSFVGLLIAALLALPAFLDLDAYKPAIVAQVKRATGRDMVIDGPIRLALLPLPSVALDGVKVANLPGSKNPNMVEVKSVTVKPALLPLLLGDVEIDEVTLAEPRIALEVDTEGNANWQFARALTEARPPVSSSGSPRPLSLARLTVENGTLISSDLKAGLSVAAEKANFSASIGAIDGPYSLAGGAIIDNAPFKVDLAVGARSAVGHTVVVALVAGGGKLSFEGSLSELGLQARLSGRASASADNLVAFAETLMRIAGQPPPHLPPLLAGKFSFDGPVDLSRSAATAKDFKLTLGKDDASGSLALTLTPALALDARFTAKRLDLDGWLAAIALPAEVAVPAVTAPAAPEPPPAPSWLATLTARLALEVGEVIYNDKPVRNVVLELEARGGAVAVPRLTVTLPGDLAVQARSTFSAEAARLTVSGQFSLSGPRLRETLSWLAVDVSSIPAGKLTRLGVNGGMESSGGNVHVTDATFELDELRGTGGIVVAFTVPLSVVTHVELGTLDLDSYLPPADRKATAAASPVASVTPILALLGPSIGLKLKVARIDCRGDAVTGVDVDVARQAGALKLNQVRAANLAGARIALRGAIASYWTREPRADFAFEVDAPDMDRVLELAGAAPAGLSALRLHGGVAGSWESLTLRDCALDTLGWSVRASGALALPGAAAGTIKSVSYRGSIVVNGQPIDAAIAADLSGGKPVIAADLKAGMLDFGRLGALRPPRAVASPEAQPIGTPLRRVDGTLKVSVASVGGAPVPLGGAEIAAALKDGVLTVSHFAGSLYGGTISLSGVVDGSRPELSFDLKGEASRLDLGEMLRHSSGSNEIGSLIRIAIDGSLSASGLALRGTGATVAELRRSMAGGARMSGHVQARADRFLQLLGSAATGAAGGVIDGTLGNVMSVLGEKGGVGVANLLNAISLVLNRFVNNDNALSGDFEIAGGVLSSRDLTLQGNRAAASIATHTDLAGATTDTTINFMLAEEPSAPYLIVTASGPVAAPSFHAVRGSASDPPGIVGIFPNLPHIPIPSVSIPLPHIPTPHIPSIFGR